MRRDTNLFAKIVDLHNLCEAWKNVRRGHRNSLGVAKFADNLEGNLLQLHYELSAGTWQPQPYRHFSLLDPKPREIEAPAVRDRVVFHAVMNVCTTTFIRRFIYDTYACISGRGTHAASMRTRHFLYCASRQWSNPYVLKCDIHKYFKNIDCNRLKLVLPKLFKDKQVLDLFGVIIGDGVGLPLGSLTSQWLANLYLDGLDHYVKDELGVKYYVRYMDDFVLIGPDKQWCKEKLCMIYRYIADNLLLRLNPKTCYYPISRGIDFVGYRHWVSKVLPRKRTVKRFKQTMRSCMHMFSNYEIDTNYIHSRVASFCGYVRYCSAYTVSADVFSRSVFARTG